MNKQELIKNTVEFVRANLEGDGSHDWHHTMRVWNTAKLISAEEESDPFIVEMAAILHDVDDWKFKENTERTKKFLSSLALDEHVRERIVQAIEDVSFKGANVDSQPSTTEGKIVQDADRLDAIGAIGIARCFAYGGHKGNSLYDPDEQPKKHSSFEDYKKHSNNSYNHFHEKLLHLKELMNTSKGKELAEDKHKFMQQFLEQFKKEVRK